MAGLRSEAEILKAFEGLDTVPGSKRKRKSLESDFVAKPREELGSWDSNPIRKTIGGQEVEVFTIGALAAALGKEIVTIRLWERKGYIPRAPYRLRAKVLNGGKTNGNRVYTRPLIESAVDEFQKRGLLGTARVEWSKHSDLTVAVMQRWAQILQGN